MAKSTQPKQVEVGSAFDLLPKSWEIVKKNWKAFAVVNILAILSALTAFSSDYDDADRKQQQLGLSTPFGGLTGFELGTILGVASIFLVVFVLISILLNAMRTVLMVKSTEGKEPTLQKLFDDSVKNWLWIRLIGLYIVMGIIIVIGFILLIVPGVIAIGRLIMAPFFMADKDMGIVDSIKASNELAKAHTGKVWAAIGVAILVSVGASILGAFPVLGPLIGVLFGIAFSLVLALRYQQIKNLKTVTVKK